MGSQPGQTRDGGPALPDREQFQVDLRGIVEILSKHLYSSEQVFVRELIQNAVDALTARANLGGPFRGRIDIHVAVTPDQGADQRPGGGHSVRIIDNGVGLTADEMRSMLATIGASSKRDVLEQTRGSFLGQFGIGLLSCFLVADEIVVRSRSARTPDAPTVQWVGSADGTYRIVPAAQPLAEPGTEVLLSARPDAARWVTPRRLRESVIGYARYVPAPVRVFVPGAPAGGEPVAWAAPPWRLDFTTASQVCLRDFGFRPINRVPLSVPALGIEGVGFVLDSWARPDVRAGDRVYLHGMLVSDTNTQLIPDSAFFLRAELEAGSLTPTASREALQDTDLLRDARRELDRQITDWLMRLSTERPAEFAQLTALHTNGIKALAEHHSGLLDVVFRTVEFETNDGVMPLAEVVERAGELVYVGSVDVFRSVAGLAAAQGGVLLINAGYANDVALLAAAARQYDLPLQEFRATELGATFSVPPAAARAATARLESLARQALSDMTPGATEPKVRVAAFFPPDIPAVLLGADAAPAAAADGGLWGELFSTMQDPPPAPELVLNFENQVVRELLRQSAGGDSPTGPAGPAGPDGPVPHGIRMLFLAAQLATGQRLDRGTSDVLTEALTALLHQRPTAPAADQGREHTSPPTPERPNAT